MSKEYIVSREYIFDERLKKLGVEKEIKEYTWDDIAEILNTENACNFSESFYRKRYKQLLENEVEALSNPEKQESTIPNTDTSLSESTPQTERLENLLREIRKEKAKLSDERVQNGAYIRAISREETLKEIARSAVEQISSRKILGNENVCISSGGNNEAVLVISDWHYGLVCNNAWNKFSPEIAEQRINKLKHEVIRHCTDAEVSKLFVINLSDLICGRIHLPLRLESRFDVITQTMRVSEILSEFLDDLSAYFDIEYYDCEDNHSRVEPNKADSLHIENFTRIIKWYLSSRLSSNKRINIHVENEYSEDIISFYCNGFRFVAVHGDKDKMSNVVENLSLMTHERLDIVLTAHMHHFAGDEVNETVVLQNGALVGTDRYAASIRKSSVPSQNLIIVSQDNPTEDIHRIILN